MNSTYSVSGSGCRCHLGLRVAQVGVAFVDRDYPSRAAFSVVDKVLDDYGDHSRNAWRAATEDSSDALVVLDPAIVKYQVQRAPSSIRRPSALLPGASSYLFVVKTDKQQSVGHAATASPSAAARLQQTETHFRHMRGSHQGIVLV